MPHNKQSIRPKQVRYIKLGQAGMWERECLSRGIIRFGFGSASPQRFPLCRAGKWNDLAKSFIDEGKDRGTATRFTNETRLFFEDDGSVLWVTFIGEEFCWGALTPDPPQPHADEGGVWRTVSGGWKRTDLNQEPLTKDRLSGSLTKLAAYRGTTCRVDVADYVIRRINGEKTPAVERSLAALEKMKASVLELMQLLHPRDFETLVDLVFTASGWRRLGQVGKTQKTLDLDIWLPSTDERAFVQVKSHTTSDELAEYIGRLEDYGPYDRMFYVFHSGSAEAKNDDGKVIVIGPEKLAGMVLDAGLVNWLIRKVS